MSRPLVRLAALVAFAFAAPLLAETLSELFQKAKEEVREQAWREALTTLDRLEAESSNPGNEAARDRLTAPIAFYRGVCEANLDEAAKAEADFAAYRLAQPGFTIDKTMYSKKAVAAFEAAGKLAARHAGDKGAAPADGADQEAESPASVSLLRRYEAFQTAPNAGEKPDERWANGPAKWLMTPEETAAWAALTSDAGRVEFVEKFWERRDPNPGSPDNPVRAEFDRRVAFADSYFRLDEKSRGSLTDPGMVFVLLGPPNRTGRKPILGSEENNISDGSSVPGYWYMAARNSVHFDGFTLTDASSGFREIWHYRRDTLPLAVSANALNVTFVTKPGRDRFVLQRDAATLAAIGAARAGTPETRVAGGTPPQ